MQQSVFRCAGRSGSVLPVFPSSWCWLRILCTLVLSLTVITTRDTWAKAQFPARYSVLFAPAASEPERALHAEHTNTISPLYSFSNNNKRNTPAANSNQGLSLLLPGAGDYRHQFISCTSKGGGKCSIMVNVLRDPRLIPNWNRDSWSKAIARHNAYQQLFSSSLNEMGEMRRRRRRSSATAAGSIPQIPQKLAFKSY